MPTPPRSRHVRCTLCGTILPGWLPIPDVPDGAMLLYHLRDFHLAAARPYLRRMETEAIDAVLMELFERVTGHSPPAQTQ